MFKDHLIIMPFRLPWNWSADYQKQTCLVLHKRNLVIAYMHESAHFFLKPKKTRYPKIHNIIFYTPKYFIPFKRFKIIEQLNQLICLSLLKLKYGLNKKIIIWIFDPVFYFYPKLANFFSNLISIYDCVDYHWSKNHKDNWMIRINETKLIKNSTYFFVNSKILNSIHQKIRQPNAIVPLGFAIKQFKKKISKKLNIVPESKKKPIIGYIGNIDFRLDFKLLFPLIKNNPQWLFVFIGDNQTEYFSKLQKLKNVYHLPQIDRAFIPFLISQFQIGIIPYDTKYPLNKYCYPMKLMEYLYMQKPVIATPIEELKSLSEFIRIGESQKEWQKHIHDLLKYPLSLEQKLNMKDFAIKNSWKNKIKAIYNSI